MIGKIIGKLTEIHGNSGYITTQSGVVYKLFLVPYFLNKVTEKVEPYTHLQVKDDDLVLFGFETYKQYQLFQMLISVDGVGPKLGFSVISYGSEDDLMNAIDKSDVVYFEGIPGVGRKTAQRIVLDLSDKLSKKLSLDSVVASPDDITVREALQSLGFKYDDIRKSLQTLDKDLSVE